MRDAAGAPAQLSTACDANLLVQGSTRENSAGSATVPGRRRRAARVMPQRPQRRAALNEADGSGRPTRGCAPIRSSTTDAGAMSRVHVLTQAATDIPTTAAMLPRSENPRSRRMRGTCENRRPWRAIVAMASRRGGGAYPRPVDVPSESGARLLLVGSRVLLAALVIHSALAVDKRGATVRHLTFKSRYVHRSERLTLVEPRGATRAGRCWCSCTAAGTTARTRTSTTPSSRRSRRSATRAPTVVFPNGGNHGYWHDRRGQSWARYVLDEVIPRAVKGAARRPEAGGDRRDQHGRLRGAGHRAPAPAPLLRGRRALAGAVARAARPRPARSTTPRTSHATT